MRWFSKHGELKSTRARKPPRARVKKSHTNDVTTEVPNAWFFAQRWIEGRQKISLLHSQHTGRVTSPFIWAKSSNTTDIAGLGKKSPTNNLNYFSEVLFTHTAMWYSARLLQALANHGALYSCIIFTFSSSLNLWTVVSRKWRALTLAWSTSHSFWRSNDLADRKELTLDVDSEGFPFRRSRATFWERVGDRSIVVGLCRGSISRVVHFNVSVINSLLSRIICEKLRLGFPRRLLSM